MVTCQPIPYNPHMQLSDQLHWLKSAISNAYLYEDKSGWVLVDTGMGKGVDPLAYLHKLGHSPGQLKHIVVTHADIDHIGNLHSIQAQSGAQIYASQLSAEHLRNATFPVHNNFFVDKPSLLMRRKPIDAGVIQTVADGDQLPFVAGLRVVATPGHTADHVAYFSPLTGILFAGDALMSRNKKLTPSPKFISLDYAQAQQSAIKLAELNPGQICCGHGAPFEHSMEDIMGLRATSS